MKKTLLFASILLLAFTLTDTNAAMKRQRTPDQKNDTSNQNNPKRQRAESSHINLYQIINGANDEISCLAHVDKFIQDKPNTNINEPVGCFYFTPLHSATSSRYYNVVEYLLQNNANPNTQDACGETPLHLAATDGEHEILGLLLDQGANPNIVNDEDDSALDLALKCNHEEAVSCIIRLGNVAYETLISAIEKHHDSPLIYYCFEEIQRRREETIEALNGLTTSLQWPTDLSKIVVDHTYGTQQ